jgi:hypothetical protein
MGLRDWFQKKSAEQCRSNLNRGIPMFIEVCQRIGACREQHVHPSDRDVKERERLINMLLSNVASQMLPPEEIIAILDFWAYTNDERFGIYTRFHLTQLSLALRKQVEQYPQP